MTEKTEKRSFVVYCDIRNQTRLLTLEQTGRLFLAMLDYAEGVQPTFADPLVQMAFSCVQPRMDRDREKYEAVCQAHREAGKKGGRPRKRKDAGREDSGPKEQPTADGGDFLRKNQMEPSKPDNVYVNESDNDNDCVLDVLDVKDAQDAQTQDPKTPDSCERDVMDALAYAQRMGYQFSEKQKRRLRKWCSVLPFEMIVLAIDRAVEHGGKSPSYILKILGEWYDRGFRSEEAVMDFLTSRKGGDLIRAV